VAKQPDSLEKLRSLRDTPTKQAAYALQLLKPGQKRGTMEAALAVLTDYPTPVARPALLAQYRYYDADGPKLDPGAYLRGSILKVLRNLAQTADLPLLEHASRTYEQMPSMHDALAAHLRAAALEVMNEVDENLAAFHSVRLMADSNTSKMSGEPALTAVKVLAGQGSLLPLYYYVMLEGEKIDEVVAESLRSLTRLPATLLDGLVEKFRRADSELIMVGLFELIMEHREAAKYSEFLLDYLKSTWKYDSYRYLALAIISRGGEALIKELLAYCKLETNKKKIDILLEILPLFLRKEPALETLIPQLQKRYERKD